MLFEEKLKQILKTELNKLVIFSIVPVGLIPFIVWYLIGGNYNIPTVWNKIGFAILYSFFIIVVVREMIIVKQLKWSIQNYKTNPDLVLQFLQERKKSLHLYQGHKPLIKLYDEALNIFKSTYSKKAIQSH